MVFIRNRSTHVFPAAVWPLRTTFGALSVIGHEMSGLGVLRPEGEIADVTSIEAFFKRLRRFIVAVAADMTKSARVVKEGLVAVSAVISIRNLVL